MTSIDWPDHLRPRYEAGVNPYEQGRKDRLSGVKLDETPYDGMGNAQRWQEGWLYQDQLIERATAAMREAARDIPEEDF